MSKTIRIVTRTSQLALWQANDVKAKLLQSHPHLNIELVGVKTEGDKRLDVSLAKIGGKGLFVKELEEKLLNEEADIAVHSLKDMPYELPKALMLAAFCEREDPRDAFLSNKVDTVQALPANSVVGTSSLRRQIQLLKMRPDLQVKLLRGNVPTRVQKMDDGEYDAVILAAAGLKRISLSHRIKYYFSLDEFLPAVGQGAMTVECREGDAKMLELLKCVDHTPTRRCVLAERAMNIRLAGNCQVPIAGFARYTNNQNEIVLSGRVGKIEGNVLIEATEKGSDEEPIALGEKVARSLLNQGAKELLKVE